jgi:hypothetical protein
MAIPWQRTVAHLPRFLAEVSGLPCPAISAMLQARNSGRQ